MAILQAPSVLAGQVDVGGAIKYMVSNNSLAIITTAGYLNTLDPSVYPLSQNDVIGCLYLAGGPSQTFALFTVSISDGIITLVPTAAPGDVLLPVTSGDFAVFNGTSGQIKDAGYLPSNAAKTVVPMMSAAVTANHVAQFADTAGTLQDGGVLGTAAAKAASDNSKATVASVAGAEVIGHIAKFSDTSGTIDGAAGVATNLGNILAGASGTAGNLTSFPGTAANGSLILAAVNAGADFSTTISNSAMAQSAVYSLPDIGAATGNIPVATAASPSKIKIILNVAVAGGSGANTVTDAFCTSTSLVLATFTAQSTPTTIDTIVPGNGSFVVNTGIDPGSSTLSYIIVK